MKSWWGKEIDIQMLMERFFDFFSFDCLLISVFVFVSDPLWITSQHVQTWQRERETIFWCYCLCWFLRPLSQRFSQHAEWKHSGMYLLLCFCSLGVGGRNIDSYIDMWVYLYICWFLIHLSFILIKVNIHDHTAPPAVYLACLDLNSGPYLQIFQPNFP